VERGEKVRGIRIQSTVPKTGERKAVFGVKKNDARPIDGKERQKASFLRPIYGQEKLPGNVKKKKSL